MQDFVGQLLIASPKLTDPNFHQSVVLMIRHGDDGSMGVVINRPLDLTVRDACERVLEIPCQVEGPLYQGGPCEGPLMVLHADSDIGDTELLPGMFLTTDKENLERLLGEGRDAIKCIAGYAGWSEGQLVSEMEEGAWLIVPASAQHIFSGGARLWPKLMTSLTGGAEINPDQIPDDPSVN